ncbi:hypothetical protein ACH5RR_039849 [Cinchona calisaya]|uniref:Uncharacterized protein n=1 Tax=Cinchona calisaya TaxID=153742 RepID=A0ABD2Y1X9_9GENT
MVSGETGPIDVCSHFEDAMRKAISDIRYALKLSFGTGKKGKLSKAVSKLRDTMEVFRPKIVEAYAHLSPIRFPEELVIFWPFVYLSELIKSAYIDLNILVDQYEEEKGHNQFQLPESVWLSVKALARINNSLNHFAPVFVVE